MMGSVVCAVAIRQQSNKEQSAVVVFMVRGLVQFIDSSAGIDGTALQTLRRAWQGNLWFVMDAVLVHAKAQFFLRK